MTRDITISTTADFVSDRLKCIGPLYGRAVAKMEPRHRIKRHAVVALGVYQVFGSQFAHYLYAAGNGLQVPEKTGLEVVVP